MPKVIRNYVRGVDAVNRRVGKCALYLVFVMMGILLLSSISRTFFNVPFDWTMEMAQFTMAAYYLLGGGYSMQLKAHVRMDVLYERWSEKKRAGVDVITSGFLIFYLVILLYGGLSSTLYSLQYGQRNYSSWGPPMAPIKIIMVIGIFLMLLQAVAVFFKDLAKARGKELV
jgi:TRAP-type mannitol/chloroaromatic compound transport system permease small subunit